MLKKWSVTFIGVSLVLSLTACGGNNNNENTTPVVPGTPAATTAPATPSPAAGTVNVAEAENLYKQNCIGCHAADLSGGMGPNLQHVAGGMTAAEIQDRIANGRGGMPAFKTKLTDDQISLMTDWLAAKS